jgi:hypothetical protein
MRTAKRNTPKHAGTFTDFCRQDVGSTYLRADEMRFGGGISRFFDWRFFLQTEKLSREVNVFLG